MSNREPPCADDAAQCPRLRAERLVLEPLVEAHATSLYPLLSDPAMWQFTEHPAPHSEAALRERYRRLRSRRSPDGQELWLNWALVSPPASDAIGFVQATISVDGGAEIGYVVGRPFQSRGFATEAVAAMLAFLTTRGVPHVAATVDARNTPSVALLTKLAFIPTNADDPRNVRWERAAANGA